MHTSNDTAAFCVRWRAFLLFAKAALSFGKRFFFPAEEAGIGDLLPGRERGKRLESHIYANLLTCFCRGDGSGHSQEKQIYHLPVLLRVIVAVLGVPSKG